MLLNSLGLLNLIWLANDSETIAIIIQKKAGLSYTNLTTIQAATATYKQRTGIESMFKDWKTGGYNFEGYHEELTSFICHRFAYCYRLHHCNYSRYRY